MSTQFPLAVFAKECFGNNKILADEITNQYCSEKAALGIIEKYCDEGKITGKREVTEEVKEYLERTKELRDEIRNADKYDADDKLGKVVCNTMLISHNAVIAEASGKKCAIDMKDENPLAKEIITFFDEKNWISKKHDIYKHVDGNFALRTERVKRFRRKYRLWIILAALLGLVLIGVAIAGYAQGVPTPEVPPADSIFDSVANWWNYNLWNKELPMKETSALRLAARKHLIIGCVLLVIPTFTIIIRPFVNKFYLKSKKRKDYMIEWCEFQYLSKLFEYAEKNMF